MFNSPNGSLVRVAGNDTVYLVVNGVLRPFNAAAIFQARGFKFANVQIISAGQFAAATVGRVAGYQDGALIKGSGPTIYLVSGDSKIGIASMAVFKRLKLSLRKVVSLSDSELSTYGDGGVQN